MKVVIFARGELLMILLGYYFAIAWLLLAIARLLLLVNFEVLRDFSSFWVKIIGFAKKNRAGKHKSL